MGIIFYHMHFEFVVFVCMRVVYKTVVMCRIKHLNKKIS